MARTVLVAGNGLSIDLIRFLNVDGVDLTNLFFYGAEVPFPGNGKPGFLSAKHCPYLWQLGARPGMDSVAAMCLIEDIITCVNAFATAPKPRIASSFSGPRDAYMLAYHELMSYLKHLFIYYDKRVGPLDGRVSQWPWVNVVKACSSQLNDYIDIIAYNYDIWLEKALTCEGISHSIYGIQSPVTGARVNIIKPHGSISFAFDRKLSKDRFQINRGLGLGAESLNRFELKYDDLDDYYLSDAIVPPAGEAGRYPNQWCVPLRTEAVNAVSRLVAGDRLIICGLSYWHVDRAEVDMILLNASPDVEVIMVNPHPPRTLTAVITSLFEHYLHFQSSSTLKDCLP